MATLYQRKDRGGQWFLKWPKPDGKGWVVRSLGTTSKRKANELRKDIEQKLTAITPAPPMLPGSNPEPLTFVAFEHLYRQWAEGPPPARAAGTVVPRKY